jgi:hypothetical protein
MFHTANGTPYLYGNQEARWLTPRLAKMGLDEKASTHSNVSINIASWNTLSGRLEQLLDGSQAENDVRPLLASSRGSRSTSR